MCVIFFFVCWSVLGVVSFLICSVIFFLFLSACFENSVFLAILAFFLFIVGSMLVFDFCFWLLRFVFVFYASCFKKFLFLFVCVCCLSCFETQEMILIFASCCLVLVCCFISILSFLTFATYQKSYSPKFGKPKKLQK